MWSDTLYLAERIHLRSVIAWASLSILAGTALVAVGAMRRGRGAPLVRHFGIQSAAWGAIELALAGVALRGLAERDVHGYARLERSLWLATGLDVGYLAVGLTLCAAGWSLGKRYGVIGAGVGIAAQGLALALLHLRFLDTLVRIGLPQ